MKTSCSGMIAFLLLFTAAGCGTRPDDIDNAKAEKKVGRVEAVELTPALVNDAAKGGDLSGQVFRVNGAVESVAIRIDSGKPDNPGSVCVYVRLPDYYAFPILCYFHIRHAEAVRALSEGDEVVIRGLCRSNSDDQLELAGCRIDSQIDSSADSYK